MDGGEFLQGLDVPETMIKFQNPNYCANILITLEIIRFYLIALLRLIRESTLYQHQTGWRLQICTNRSAG